MSHDQYQILLDAVNPCVEHPYVKVVVNQGQPSELRDLLGLYMFDHLHSQYLKTAIRFQQQLNDLQANDVLHLTFVSVTENDISLEATKAIYGLVRYGKSVRANEVTRVEDWLNVASHMHMMDLGDAARFVHQRLIAQLEPKPLVNRYSLLVDFIEHYHMAFPYLDLDSLLLWVYDSLVPRNGNEDSRLRWMEWLPNLVSAFCKAIKNFVEPDRQASLVQTWLDKHWRVYQSSMLTKNQVEVTALLQRLHQDDFAHLVLDFLMQHDVVHLRRLMCEEMVVETPRTIWLRKTRYNEPSTLFVIQWLHRTESVGHGDGIKPSGSEIIFDSLRQALVHYGFGSWTGLDSYLESDQISYRVTNSRMEKADGFWHQIRDRYYHHKGSSIEIPCLVVHGYDLKQTKLPERSSLESSLVVQMAPRTLS